MEELKNFINSFLKAEVEASDASIKPNLEDYNQKLDFMNSFCVEELYNKFGMIPHKELKSEEFYERWKDAEPANTRHIYKISQYNDTIYGEVYVVYLSLRNPIEEIFRYGDCLFVTKINEELRIIKTYLFSSEVGKTRKFELPKGVEDISFKTLKKTIHIERYLEPLNDKDGMEHYSKNV